MNQKIQLRNLSDRSTERQRGGKNEGEVKTRGGKNKKSHIQLIGLSEERPDRSTERQRGGGR